MTSPPTSQLQPAVGAEPAVACQTEINPMPEVESGLSSAPGTASESSETSSLSPEPESKFEFWRIFFSTFVTIFLAELGDKTQVTTLLMSAESHAPWVVFLGAGTALIATSLIGVLLGQWLAQRLSPRTLDTATGILLLGITVWLLWDVSHL